MPEKDQSKSGSAARTPRKRFTTPRLQEYGPVAKLTQSGGSTKTETGNPMMKKCL